MKRKYLKSTTAAEFHLICQSKSVSSRTIIFHFYHLLCYLGPEQATCKNKNNIKEKLYSLIYKLTTVYILQCSYSI